ncbi:hypothetical protein AB5I83_09570 [Mesobacillus sp. LC4]
MICFFHNLDDGAIIRFLRAINDKDDAINVLNRSIPLKFRAISSTEQENKFSSQVRSSILGLFLSFTEAISPKKTCFPLNLLVFHFSMAKILRGGVKISLAEAREIN